MAKARQCDRCGNFYTENCKHQPVKPIHKNYSICGIQTTLDYGMYWDEYYDLCDDCLEKLFAFLNEYKEDEIEGE